MVKGKQMKLVSLESHEFGRGWWFRLSIKVSDQCADVYEKNSDGASIRAATNVIRHGIDDETGYR